MALVGQALNVSGVCFLHCLLILNPSPSIPIHPHPQRGTRTLDVHEAPSWYLCVGTYPKDDRAWTRGAVQSVLYAQPLSRPRERVGTATWASAIAAMKQRVVRYTIYDRYMMRDGIAHICSTLTLMPQLSGASGLKQGQGQVGEHTGGRGTRNNTEQRNVLLSANLECHLSPLSLLLASTTDHRPPCVVE